MGGQGSRAPLVPVRPLRSEGSGLSGGVVPLRASRKRRFCRFACSIALFESGCTNALSSVNTNSEGCRSNQDVVKMFELSVSVSVSEKMSEPIRCRSYRNVIGARTFWSMRNVSSGSETDVCSNLEFAPGIVCSDGGWRGRRSAAASSHAAAALQLHRPGPRPYQQRLPPA